MSGSGGRGGGTSGVGLWGLITWPVRLVLGVVSGTWYLLSKSTDTAFVVTKHLRTCTVRTFLPLSLVPRLPRFLLPPSFPTNPSYRTRDPTTTHLSFIRDLEQFTGSCTSAGGLPEFWIGPYREFLTAVRKEGKVGMVVLVCGEHEDDEEFKRDVLCDGELVQTLKDKDVMVWAQDIRSREGFQGGLGYTTEMWCGGLGERLMMNVVSQTLLATTYPSLTFLSLLPSSPHSNSTSSTRLSILSSLAGPPSTTTSASSIIQTLTTSVLPRATPFLNRLKRERLTLEEARHLRSEQDKAFKAAEQRDREKMQAQKQAEELERIKLERSRREAAEKEKWIQDRKVWRRYARKHLLPPSTGPIRVALRTPLSAERNVRHFQPGPSTTSLFIFAETLLIPSNDTSETDPDSPPTGYEPDWDFRIVTAYPRKEVERVDNGGEGVWEVVQKAGGALFAEKVEGGVWADAEMKELNGDSSDEEVEE